MKESRSSRGQISSIQPQRKKTSREQVGRVGWPIGAYWGVLAVVGGGLVLCFEVSGGFEDQVSGLSGRVGLSRWWYYTTPAFGGVRGGGVCGSAAGVRQRKRK